MNSCCSPEGYRWFFSERSARSEARRYRRRGLDGTSRRVVELIKAQGVEGRTVLEVGGGIGAIQIELLKAGAVRALSVELTPTYEAVARELLAEAGLDGRVERSVRDFARSGDRVPSADIVVLNRVICCYPDMPRLTVAAADHANELLVMSYPRASWWIRLGLGLGNFLLWITRREFHVFAHSPRAIIATSEQRGLRRALDERGLLWIVSALRRAA